MTHEIVAMKRVPIENDYDNLLKEIQHMKQCQSDYIVKCYGSYYYGSELWVSAPALDADGRFSRLLVSRNGSY